MKKKIIKWKHYTDTINERNTKFKCEHCRKEIYSKKVKYGFREGDYTRICLECLVSHYEGIIMNCRAVTKSKDLKEITKILSRALKEIKKEYALELVALEL